MKVASRIGSNEPDALFELRGINLRGMFAMGASEREREIVKYHAARGEGWREREIARRVEEGEDI